MRKTRTPRNITDQEVQAAADTAWYAVPAGFGAFKGQFYLPDLFAGTSLQGGGPCT